MERWKLINKIEEIINRNCVEIPWEGSEVNKSRLIEDFLDLIDELKKYEERIEKIGYNFEDYL